LAKKEREEQDKPRRRLAGWWTLATASACLALAATAFGFVVTGPVTVGAETGVVTEPTASPTASPADSSNEAEPVPAITAPSPSPSAGGDTEVFDAPQIKIEPPPAPPKKGVRQTTTTGTSPYLGMTAAQYCALKLPAFPTSGSDPTAFLVAANKERAQTGAPALTWNGTLATFAQNWSNQMASDQDATGYAYGSDEWYAGVFRHSGGPYAENIAFNYGYSNPVNVAQSGWMASTGHCLNIMNPNYSQMGAGKAQAADESWFFTEEFTW